MVSTYRLCWSENNSSCRLMSKSKCGGRVCHCQGGDFVSSVNGVRWRWSLRRVISWVRKDRIIFSSCCVWREKWQIYLLLKHSRQASSPENVRGALLESFLWLDTSCSDLFHTLTQSYPLSVLRLFIFFFHIELLINGCIHLSFLLCVFWWTRFL